MGGLLFILGIEQAEDRIGWDDRLGRVVHRKAGSVQEPGGHRTYIPRGIYLGVSIGAL